MKLRMVVGVLVCMACSPLLAAQQREDPAANVLYKVGPRYPRHLQSAQIGGTGVFRMIIDFKTGKVTDVQVVKSTGNDELDREAFLALRRWRFKPGKLTKADMPITFHDGKTPLVLPPGAKLLRAF
jgi:TonB family protein